MRFATGSEGDMELLRVQSLFESILEQVGRVVVGQQELVEGVVLALFAEGSVLIEGPPGLGKTLLVNVLSKAVSCQFRRVQFTPDLMPSDLTGHSIYDLRKQEFSFNPGPVFTNLLLTDEINRSPPKTQSALLEVMQEQQVSVDGTTHMLQRPFLVIATQNPIE
ncbi:MAG: AAA family ATPase, partial [Planctomycetaceae bacterium]